MSIPTPQPEFGTWLEVRSGELMRAGHSEAEAIEIAVGEARDEEGKFDEVASA